MRIQEITLVVMVPDNKAEPVGEVDIDDYLRWNKLEILESEIVSDREEEVNDE